MIAEATQRSKAAKSIATALAYTLLLPGMTVNPACAQEYPVKSVRIVAPFPAGGGTDLNVRRLAEQLGKLWGQPVVVENIAGAAGGVAAVNVARSKPDGYTLFLITHPILAINPVIYDKLAYDADKDFAAVVQVSETPSVLVVNPSLQVAKVSELITLAKANPGALRFGSGGVGTTLHLSGELFKATAGVDITHVPYKGGAPAVTALIGNEIQLLFDSSSAALRHMQTGRVNGIAVSSMNRLAAAPNLPTFGESGLKGFVSTLAHGVVVPAATSPALVAAINRGVNTVLKNSEYRNLMADDGIDVVGGSPEQFAQFLTNERKKWGALIQKLGLKAQY
ncbi:MAG: protein bugT-like protein [Betaproteobacteria bacterium]|nr:protein bugT-like protein [Betaproteobacteria bacterium]